MKQIVFGMMLIGLAWVALAPAQSPPPTVGLSVWLPSPGYPLTDGTYLTHTEFKRTDILYGTCSPTTEIDELMGTVEVKSYSFHSPQFQVPINTQICIVAVVIGLDDQPMGRSYVAKYFTTLEPGRAIPSAPYILQFSE